MKDPAPIHLSTPAEMREAGWQAEARDSDGHVMSAHAPFKTISDLEWYYNESMEQGLTITIWPGHRFPEGAGE